MFTLSSKSIIVAFVASAFIASASFGAPVKKMGGHKVVKSSKSKSQLVHQKKNALEQPAEPLSEEELFQQALKSKSISNDGKILTDKRDGKKYSIEIRGDKAWMKKNLAFSISTPRQCLMEDEKSCQKYGRFYSHQEASKACPAGWHLPDDGEWRDYQKDRSKLDWKDLGQGGCKSWDGYCESSSTGHYWSASSVKKNTGRSWEFRSAAKSINRTDEESSKGLYVRCVADLR
ncbi:MAG: hypothetical protein HUK19_02165 [Fibrobacter sp.]|nr:hypothetical protein [Fibrobacter sp.]